MSAQKKSLISNLSAAKKALIASGKMSKPETAGAVKTAVKNGVRYAVTTNVKTLVR